MKALALGLAFCTALAQAGQRYTCPDEIPEGAVAITQPPAGWTGHVGAPLTLRSAGIKVGYLEHSGVQLGEATKLKNGQVKVAYPYLWDSKKEKWLTCEYGDTGIELGTRLPADTARCVIVFTPAGRNSYKIDATCG